MKVTLLGTGTPAPNPSRRQSAVLIEIGPDALLFDAGRGTLHQLARADVPIDRIDPVFVTHHHFDHIGELFDVAVTGALCGRSGPLRVHGPPGTAEIVRGLVDVVYARDLRSRDLPRNDVMTGRDVAPGPVAATDRWRVIAERVRHGDFDDAPEFDWQCFGYRIEAEGKAVVVSGDTVPCAGIVRLAAEADLLIQCCHFPESSLADPAVREMTDHTLPSTTQAGTIASRANARRVVLTHLSSRIDGPEAEARALDEVRRTYDGPVTPGADLMTFDV